MRILGIETSCDETGLCILEASGEFGSEFRYTILGNALYSQAALHAQYGGVFPNLAKREHSVNLVPLFEDALRQADMLKAASSPNPGSMLLPLKTILEREPELFNMLVAFLLRHEKPAIDAIAVTHGPGLEPALWVGINFARALSSAWKLPIVAVNHMEGHIVLSMMDSDRLKPVEFPALSLLISGGHTELVLSKEFESYEVIGETRDDAAGEAFDKVARMLDLAYPGGPEISRLAAEAREKNLEPGFKFTRPMMHEDSFDFSFSGLKTAVRKLVEAHAPLSDEMKLKIAREFEDTVADVLVAKTLKAIEAHSANTVIVGGGVSANIYIRKLLAEKLEATGVQLLIPPPELATDNAVMIALAGYFHSIKRDFISLERLEAKGNLRLT